MTDFLDDKVKEIDDRLQELQPLVDEHQRLEAAAKALSGIEPAPAGRAAAGRRGGRSRSARPRARSRARSAPARRAGGDGTRGAQALSLVSSKPGITIPDLAREMGIKPNYLYRVLPVLAQDGKVRRQGKGWYPSAS